MTKYIISENINIGDIETEDGLKSKVVDIDKTNGKITWEIDYIPNFELVYDNLYETNKDFKELAYSKNIDNEIKEIYNEFKNVFSKYKKYIKTNYNEIYQKIINK